MSYYLTYVLYIFISYFAPLYYDAYRLYFDLFRAHDIVFSLYPPLLLFFSLDVICSVTYLFLSMCMDSFMITIMCDQVRLLLVNFQDSRGILKSTICFLFHPISVNVVYILESTYIFTHSYFSKQCQLENS